MQLADKPCARNRRQLSQRLGSKYPSLVITRWANT